MNKISEGYQRVSDSSRLSLALAFALTALLFAVASAAWVPNVMNDDWAISLTLSGRFEADEGLTLFLNPLLSSFIYWLNTSIGHFNWFFVVELICSYLCYWLLSFALIRYAKPVYAGIAFSFLTAIILPGMTIFDNFSVTAGICAAAGGALLLLYAGGKTRSLAFPIIGVLLYIASSLWRWQVFLLSLPFFAGPLLVLAITDKGIRRDFARVLRLALPLTLVLVSCMGLRAYDESALAEEPWGHWRQVVMANSVINDYPFYPYDQVSDELQEIGVSYNDFRLVTNWITEDPDFFTLERLQAIGDISRNSSFSLTNVISGSIAYAKAFFQDPWRVVLLALFVVAVCLYGDKSKRRWMLAIIFGGFLIALSLKVLGRLPDRVHDPLWLFVLISTVLLDTPSGQVPTIASGLASTIDRLAKPVISLTVAVACVGMFGYSIVNYTPERITGVFAADSFEPTCTLTDYVEEHPDNIFVFDVLTNQDLKRACALRGLPTEDYISRTVILGGWDARAPFVVSNNKSMGAANPIKALVDNENALYVCDPNKPPKRILAYLQEHYYPNARCEIVDTIPDSKRFGTLDLYRFYQE